MRCPFIFAPAGEERYTRASAICSAGTKAPQSLSGFFSRMAGVRMAGTTTTLAVAALPLKPLARARTTASDAALAVA